MVQVLTRYAKREEPEEAWPLAKDAQAALDLDEEGLIKLVAKALQDGDKGVKSDVVENEDEIGVAE